jgi:hypothetical protein
MSSVDIHRKANGRWEVRWREAGRRRGRTFDRKADATDFRDYVRGRIQRAGIADLNAGRQPLWQFIEEWWRLYAIPNLAPDTRDVYIRLWEKHLEPRVGTYQLRELTPAVIADLRLHLEREVGAPTVIKAMGILQAVCKQAVIHGCMELNPGRGRRQATATAHRGTLSPHAGHRGGDPRTARSLRRDPRLRPRLRTGPMAAVERRQRSRSSAKGSSRSTLRVVRVFGPHTRSRLALTWRQSSEVAPWGRRPIPRPQRRPWSDHDWRNWRRRVYQPAAAAGVTGDLRPYRLRSSFVSLLLWEGRSVTYVAAQAGHSVQTLSRHYAGVLAELEDGDIRVSATDVIRTARQSVRRALDALDAEDAAQRGSAKPGFGSRPGSPVSDSNRRPLPYHGPRGG